MSSSNAETTLTTLSSFITRVNIAQLSQAALSDLGIDSLTAQ